MLRKLSTYIPLYYQFLFPYKLTTLLQHTTPKAVLTEAMDDISKNQSLDIYLSYLKGLPYTLREWNANL